MEITKIESFLAYYEKTRLVTNKVIEAAPPQNIDWSYMPGKFTIAGLIRHMAAIERYVFAAVAKGDKPSYRGCGKELADGYQNVLSYFHQMHEQSMAIFSTLTDESLERNVNSLDGKVMELRNFLRALIVHEIHHRAALCIYLNLLNVATPPIIGLMEEQVIQLCK